MSEPLVPPDCDLRDFSFTPIFRSRLFGSSFHAHSTDAEWRAGVTLWLKSWDQVPAGSLPDQEIDLCRLAELGRDLRTWRKISVGAMRGWVKCSDGRLYHPVVAEGVLEAWTRRCKMSGRGKAGADARWGISNATSNSTSIPMPVENDSTSNASSIKPDGTSMSQAMLADSKGQGQGQGQEERKEGAREEPVDNPTKTLEKINGLTSFAAKTRRLSKEEKRQAWAGKIANELCRRDPDHAMATIEAWERGEKWAQDKFDEVDLSMRTH